MTKYWLDPNGKRTSAGGSHEDAAKTMLRGGSTADAFRALLDRGYLRIVVKGRQIFFNGKKKPTSKQLDHLTDWAQEGQSELIDDSSGRPQIIWTPVEGGMSTYEKKVTPKAFAGLLETYRSHDIKHIPFSEVPVGKWFSGYGPGWNKYTKYRKTSDTQAVARDGRTYKVTDALLKTTVEAYL